MLFEHGPALVRSISKSVFLNGRGYGISQRFTAWAELTIRVLWSADLPAAEVDGAVARFNSQAVSSHPEKREPKLSYLIWMAE
jgi:hypothetical protein